MDRTTTLDIDGMTCGNCVAHVTRALEEVPGVLNVSVELRAGQTSPVTLVSNTELDSQTLADAVAAEGYTLSGVR